MAWTYDPTDLSADKDRVRFKIGDTNSADPQLEDEEILYLLDLTGSVDGAVKRAAEALAFKYARQADKWVGDLKILASQKSRAYRELAEGISASASVFFGVPYAGGIRVGDKETVEADTDLVSPSFRRGLHDNLAEE